MDHDRALALGRPGTELAGMTIPLEHLRPQPGEVAAIPVPPGIAARAVAGDQLSFRATEPGTTGRSVSCGPQTYGRKQRGETGSEASERQKRAC